MSEEIQSMGIERKTKQKCIRIERAQMLDAYFKQFVFFLDSMLV